MVDPEGGTFYYVQGTPVLEGLGAVAKVHGRVQERPLSSEFGSIKTVTVRIWT